MIAMAHIHHEDHSKASVAGELLSVEVTRGRMTESRHRVAFAIVDRSGTVLAAAGDLDMRIYARSAIKPLQALALVETGAADSFGIGEREIALACASHSGEQRHVDAVDAWLQRIGCTGGDLACGAHPPLNENAAAALGRARLEPSPVHNNCSGKHLGFLSVARHLGYPTQDYIRQEHPVQQRVLGILERMSGCDLGDAPRGIDGCGIPVIGIPIGNVAFAMAQLADPRDQPEPRQDAARRVCAAMVSEPFYVAGTDRFDSWAIRAADGRAVVKAGAEGVHAAALLEDGIGIVLKVEDGAKRAAEAVMANILLRCDALPAAGEEALREMIEPAVRDHAGHEVGRIRVAHLSFGGWHRDV